MKLLVTLFLPFIALLAGCGIQNYDYRVTPKFSGQTGHQSVAVAGVDEREYFKNGDVKAFYVGLIRDIMVAIPYRVRTTSRQPLSDEFALDVAKGLRQIGGRATWIPNPHPMSLESAMKAARQTGSARILIVRIREYQSDSQIRTELTYDLGFELYDQKGRLIATNRIHDQKMYPGHPLPYAAARGYLPKELEKILARGVNPLVPKL